MLNYLPVGVIVLKSNNNPKFVNKEILSIFPFDLESTVKPTTPNLQKELDLFETMSEQNEPHTTLKSAITSVELGTEKVYRMCLKEKTFEVKTKILPISSGKSSKIAVVKDQSIYETLIKEKTLEKYQKMLLSSISHEIRNPLNAIEGYLTIIKEAKESYENYYLKLKSSANQIAFIVDGACDLLLSENKTLILQPRSFSVKDSVSEVYEILSPNFENKPIDIAIKYGKNLPHAITSDPKRYKITVRK